MTDLDARYDRINQQWAASGIPLRIFDTPDWQSGWDVLMDWVYQLMERADFTNARSLEPVRPSYHATWLNEVHIFSHMWNRGVGGHSLDHIAIEEEGARLVLEWWSDKQINCIGLPRIDG